MEKKWFSLRQNPCIPLPLHPGNHRDFLFQDAQRQLDPFGPDHRFRPYHHRAGLRI